MRVNVNGDEREVPEGTTIGALVDTLLATRHGVAVAVDGEVATRSSWDTTVLHVGARIEIVGAVQGG